MYAFRPRQNRASQVITATPEPVRAVARPMSCARNHVANLQHAYGNQATLRLLRSQSSVSETTTPGNFGTPQMSLQRSVCVQSKLRINAPGDVFKREADRVADQVMGIPERRVAAVPVSGAASTVQRECACGGSCADCQGREDEQDLQMKPEGPSGAGLVEAPPVVHEVLRSPGQPLDSATRAFMEPRFGQDFRREGTHRPVLLELAPRPEEPWLESVPSVAPTEVGAVLESSGEPLAPAIRAWAEPRMGFDFEAVRVHRGEAAAKSAKAIDARAYTAGKHIVFGQGQYQPSTQMGRQIIAHELAHVIQQSNASNAGRLVVAASSDPAEAQAEGAARAVASGHAPPMERDRGSLNPGSLSGMAGSRVLQRRVIDDSRHVTCRPTRANAVGQIQAAETEAIRILQLGAEVARSRARGEAILDLTGETLNRHGFRDLLWRRFHVNYEDKAVREAWLQLIPRRLDWLANAIGRMSIVYRCGAPGVEPPGDCTDSPNQAIAWSKESGDDIQLCDAFWSFNQPRAVLHEWFHLGFGLMDCEGFANVINTVCWDTFARELAGEADPGEQTECCPPPDQPLPPFRGARG